MKALAILNDQQLVELINLWHIALVALSGKDDSRYQRMLWASKEYNEAHPEISSTAAYKNLDRTLNGEMVI